MTLKLDKVNRGPHLSTLVASSISREIAQGRLKPGDQLPTEQALATTFGVSRNVVREAIARLRSEGRIWSQQGRGAFVADGKLWFAGTDGSLTRADWTPTGAVAGTATPIAPSGSGWASRALFPFQGP